MSPNYRWLGARGARLRAAWVLAALALLAGVPFEGAGCGLSTVPASPSTPASPSAAAPSVADAYAAAHPTGGLPATLRTAAVPRPVLARRVCGIVGTGVRVVLPASLPPGFKVAAPYIAVGDGTARPNPEGWGESYRVSYTDGRGLLVMTVGAEHLPERVVWGARRVRVDGRPASVGRAGDELVIATTDGDPRIVITGRRVAWAAAVKSAASVAVLP